MRNIMMSMQQTMQQSMQAQKSENEQLKKTLKMLETQVGQMAANNVSRQPGSLPSQPLHSNETANAITLRSGVSYEGSKRSSGDKDKGKEVVIDDSDEKIDEGDPQNKQGSERENKEHITPNDPSSSKTKVPTIPFPQRTEKSKIDKQFGKFVSLVKSLEVTIPFSDLVMQISAYTKFLKDILTKKRMLHDVETVALTEQCSAILQNRSIPKLKDPGSFSIPCNIGPVFIDKGLCDLGASVSVLPLPICKKFDMELKCTGMTLQLADRSVKYPMGILEDVPVRVGKFYIPIDFVVLDIEEDARIPIILGRDFLATAGAVIDVKNGSITLNIGDEKITFNLDLALKGPMLENSLCRIDIVDRIVDKVMWEVYEEEKSKENPYGLNKDNLEELDNQEGMEVYAIQEESAPNIATTEATKGSSLGQFFSQYLKPIKLNDVDVKWKSMNLSYILEENYSNYFASLVKKATPISGTDAVVKANNVDGDVYIKYEDQSEFESIARQFGIFEEWKDGVPRTAYKGVVVFRYNGPNRVFFVGPDSLKQLGIE